MVVRLHNIDIVVSAAPGTGSTILRMEDLDQTAPALLGFDAMPHDNRTPRPTPYWQYYSEHGRMLVTSVHGPDLERFGYRF